MSTYSAAKKKSNQAYYKKHRKYYNAYQRRYYRAHKATMLRQNQESRLRVKDEAFAAYGGYICFCCGETIKQFLTLDHVANNGNAHRRALKTSGTQVTGYGIYYWLKRHHYPPIMQVACYNCNCGRAKNNGVCPHKVSLPS